METLVEVFRDTVARVPNRVALTNDQVCLTFAELDRRSEEVARGLAIGAADRAPLPILIGNAADGLVALIATLKSGRPVAPLDARAPSRYLADCIDQLGARDVLADESTRELAARLVPPDGVSTVDELAAGASGALPVLTPDDPCAINFTSGSTGRPKGVVFTQGCVLASSMRTVERIALADGDVVAAVSASGGMFWGAPVVCMITGATASSLDLARYGVAGIRDWIRRNDVTILPVPRGLLRTITAAVPPGPRLDPVRLVCTGGEPLLPGDLERVRAVFPPGTEVLYEYGTIESGIVAGLRITEAGLRTAGTHHVVGWPEPAAMLEVVGEDSVPVPAGMPGEIVVGGPTLTAGYLGQPELTEARFRGTGDARRFWTGDVGILREDGTLEFVGRVDDRLKVRGYTIEPAQVEAALTSIDGIDEAAVTSVPDPSGAPRLVAHVIPAAGGRLTGRTVRTALAELVPRHMVPTDLFAVPDLPRLPGGKLDRAAVTRVAAESLATTAPYQPPADDRERELAAIVAEILQLDRVGRNDDVFDLGADSLDLLEILAAIDDRYGVDLPAGVLAEAPTVAQLAAHLAHPDAVRTSTIVPMMQGGDKVPFFCAPGSGSTAFELRPLAAALRREDDRSFYAIIAHGVERRARPDRTIDAAVRRQLANLREVRPSGPYLLGGHSGGGLIALEMARRLRRDGEDVPLVVLLDTYFTNDVRGALGMHREVARRRWPAGDLRSRWRRLRNAAHHVRRQCRQLYRRRTAGIVRRRGEAQTRAFLALQGHMLRRYRLQDYEGPVLLVSAWNRPRGEGEERWRSVDAALAEHLPALTEVTVRGEHLTLISPGYVDEVAEALMRAFEDVGA